MPDNNDNKDLLRLRTRITKRFRRTCASGALLQDGDRILIALSGGKDSLALVEFLGRQAQIYVPRIQLCAVHVRVENRAYVSDTAYLERFCAQAGVPFRLWETAISGEETKDPCFLCSWYRRKALFEAARELDCNKIAFGHHRDDVLETLLLNLVYEGRLDTIPPALPLDKMPLTLIRPFWAVDEADIARYALLAGYERQKQLCPFEHHSRRHDMTALLRQLQTLNPEVRSSLLHALTRKQ